MDLEKLYDEYVIKRRFYRVVPKKSVSQVLSQGLSPQKNPFARHKRKIFTFLEIVEKLSKKGYKMYHWWGFWADELRIIETKRNDLSKSYIDFCNSYDITMYRKLKGGAMVWALYLLSAEIIDRGMPLSAAERKKVKEMLAWADAKLDSTSVIQISAADKTLNSARLRYGHNLYLPSPFGTFENFSKRMKANGTKIYLPYLTGKKKFFIRCKEKIPAKNIKLKK